MKDSAVNSDLDVNKEEKKKKRKRRKITISKIMTPIVMALFVLVLLMVLNYQSFCHFCNKSSYATVTAAVAKKTTDSVAMVIPMVELQYRYEGEDYEVRKLFVLEPLYGLSSEEGNKLEVYVNKNAPGYCLFKVDFFKSMVNIILLFFGLAFIALLIQRIVRGVRNVIERWRERKAEEEEEDEEEKKEVPDTPEDIEFREDMELYRLLENDGEEDENEED